MGPINEALQKAGLKISDINDIELLGGGVRVPKVIEILKKETGKELGSRMNGDEAMCFGSAFMASNSSADFKVKQIFLTQNPNFDVHVKIMPIDPADALSVEEQQAEGIEEADIIKYTQDFRLFNTSDYFGKSKALNMNYNKNMKIELYKSEPGSNDNLELLETFLLKDVKYQLDAEIKYLKAEQVRAAEKALKEKNKKEADEKKKKDEASKDKEDGDAKKEDAKNEDAKKDAKAEAESVKINPDDLPAIPTPKLKISIELSRSGYMLITKAAAGTHAIQVDKVRRDKLLTKE